MQDRYSRQMLFQPIGKKGQHQLKESHVLIVGAGALGTSSAEMLVRSGVGHVTLVDRDYVGWSNLQRQQLYTEEDARLRTPKALAAARHLEKANSEAEVTPCVLDMLDFTLQHSMANFHLILDATDNFGTRMYVNDLALKHGIPWIYAGALGSTGMTYTILPAETPCLSCMLKILPDQGDTCDTTGVISPIVQWVTAHQVAEAMKLLIGHKESLRKTLLTANLWTNEQSSIKVDAMKQPDCPSCGTHPTYPYLREDKNMKTTVLCGRDTVQIRPDRHHIWDLSKVKAKLQSVSQKITANDFLVHAHLDEHHRIVVFQDGRVLLHGMSDMAEAQSVYDRYIRQVTREVAR